MRMTHSTVLKPGTSINFSMTFSIESETHRSTNEQCHLFLLKDNTVISFFERDGSIITDPIGCRLQSESLPIRKNEDSSFLIHSILDGIIDHYFPIIESFTDQINEMHTIAIKDAKLEHTKSKFIIYIMT